MTGTSMNMREKKKKAMMRKTKHQMNKKAWSKGYWGAVFKYYGKQYLKDLLEYDTNYAEDDWGYEIDEYIYDYKVFVGVDIPFGMALNHFHVELENYLKN